MRYVPLIWAQLWRKKTRTILTLLSIVVAFLLYGLLHGITASFDRLIGNLSESRLHVMSRLNMVQPLPMSHLQKIERVPGVQNVAYYAWFGGYYQDPKNAIDAGAVDIDRIASVFPTLILPAEQRAAMAKSRTGAVVGYRLAERFGWKIGDRVPLRTSVWLRKDGTDDWTFDIVGIVRFKDDELQANEMWINYAYFDEARAFGTGGVNQFLVTIAPGVQPTRTAEEIDRLFENSPNETLTQNSMQRAWAMLEQIGNISLFVNAIIAAVLTALLFLIANMMMQTVRERTPELAVLRTFGYSNFKVTALLVAEALAMCLVAGAIGIGLSALLLGALFGRMKIDGAGMPLGVALLGFGLAIGLGVVSSMGPALRVRRLQIVDALAGR